MPKVALGALGRRDRDHAEPGTGPGAEVLRVAEDLVGQLGPGAEHVVHESLDALAALRTLEVELHPVHLWAREAVDLGREEVGVGHAEGEQEGVLAKDAGSGEEEEVRDVDDGTAVAAGVGVRGEVEQVGGRVVGEDLAEGAVGDDAGGPVLCHDVADGKVGRRGCGEAPGPEALELVARREALVPPRQVRVDVPKVLDEAVKQGGPLDGVDAEVEPVRVLEEAGYVADDVVEDVCRGFRDFCPGDSFPRGITEGAPPPKNDEGVCLGGKLSAEDG